MRRANTTHECAPHTGGTLFAGRRRLSAEVRVLLESRDYRPPLRGGSATRVLQSMVPVTLRPGQRVVLDGRALPDGCEGSTVRRSREGGGHRGRTSSCRCKEARTSGAWLRRGTLGAGAVRHCC